jgi:acetyl-CoA C-acetyltransferase
MTHGDRVALVAAGITRWGKRQATFRDLVAEAGKATFDSNTNIKPADLKSFIISTVYPERSAYQGHPAPLAAEWCGVKPNEFHCRVENQCGSGTTAIRTAYAAIKAGLTRMVMIVGVEKMMIPSHQEIFLNAMAGGDREWEACFGVTPPPLFAMVAQAHMKRYGTTEEQLAMVAAKNHNHSVNNPNAHHQKGATVDQIMGSRPVANPLKLFDCTTNTDGAAGVIVAAEELAKDLCDKPVYILGTAQINDGYPWANYHKDWSSWPALKEAADKAYAMAGITPTDVDVAELHDCFSISEILEYEELGFCPKGEGGRFVQDGLSDHGGQVVVNPGGGLLACGHPFGATGIRQSHEVFIHLRGEAGKRQVADARIALTHNLSGLGEHHLLIYGSES